MDENKHWELMRLWSRRNGILGRTYTRDGYVLQFQQETPADSKQFALIIKVEKIDALLGGPADLGTSCGASRCSSPETYSSYLTRSGATLGMGSTPDVTMQGRKNEGYPFAPDGVKHVPWPGSDDESSVKTKP